MQVVLRCARIGKDYLALLEGDAVGLYRDPYLLGCLERVSFSTAGEAEDYYETRVHDEQGVRLVYSSGSVVVRVPSAPRSPVQPQSQYPSLSLGRPRKSN